MVKCRDLIPATQLIIIIPALLFKGASKAPCCFAQKGLGDELWRLSSPGGSRSAWPPWNLWLFITAHFLLLLMTRRLAFLSSLFIAQFAALSPQAFISGKKPKAQLFSPQPPSRVDWPLFPALPHSHPPHLLGWLGREKSTSHGEGAGRSDSWGQKSPSRL